MNRKIKHLRIVSLVIYSIQIIGVILVTLLYVFNVFNLKSLMLPEYFAFIAAGLTVFNSFYILIVFIFGLVVGVLGFVFIRKYFYII